MRIYVYANRTAVTTMTQHMTWEGEGDVRERMVSSRIYVIFSDRGSDFTV